jgi:DNA-3-methyladenine glycosylase
VTVDRDESLVAWLLGPVDRVAPRLLGCRVAHAGVVVRLTEVEAYSGAGTDPASHAHRGPTPRNAVMFGPPGFAYVYFTYGMHWCLNVVTGAEGEAAAVLLRAGAVVEGLDVATARRPAARSSRELARGPARLAAALALDGSFTGTDLLDPRSALRLLPPADGARVAARSVARGPRVGIRLAAERPWRFWVDGEPTVSAYRVGGRARRSPAAPSRTGQ